MCGICGAIDFDEGRPIEAVAARVKLMRRMLAHRGPDDAGLLIDEANRLVLGHRRLSVVDLTEAGAQPMRSADERFALVYNGEIYNTEELRARLGSDVRWRGHCDTEVLLEYLIRFGVEATVRDMNGMFAFAFVDRRERVMYLARDRFGKKPLYFAGTKEGRGVVLNEATGFLFTSELRPIVAAMGANHVKVSRDGLAEYLLLQYVHAPRTLFEEVWKLRPGCVMEVRWDGSRKCLRVSEAREYFRWEPGGEDAESEGNERSDRVVRLDVLADALDTLIDRAVERRMVSDVPLGVMLSSGVDSALVASSMVRVSSTASVRVRSFSMGFVGSVESEHDGAAEAARAIGTEHYCEMISTKVCELMPRIAGDLDEALGDSGCLPMWCLSKMTRREVTVALTGDGGDEMFGGYQRYAETLREEESMIRRMRYRLRNGKRWKANDAYCSPRWWMFMPDVIGEMLGGFPDGAIETAQRMRAALSDEDLPLIHQMRSLDAATYMPGAVLAKVDCMTMAFGLEARSPLLDPEIAEFAARLPAAACYDGPVLKPILRRVLAKRYPGMRLHERPKRGFGLPGLGWSQREMVEMLRELVAANDSECRNYLEKDAVKRWVEGQADEGTFSIFRVWTMLTLELYLRSIRKTLSSAKDETKTGFNAVGRGLETPAGAAD